MPFSDERSVTVPRWIYKISVWLLTLLSMGFVATVFIAVLWLGWLSYGQHEINKNVEEVKKAVEGK